MLKPERIWAVGDKTFPTYEEARTYIGSRRSELQFENLVDIVHNELLGQGFTDENTELAMDIASAVSKKFKLTLRK
jgi:hypothetical protein